MEAKFKDVEFARKAYTKIVKRIIDAGVRASPYLLSSWSLVALGKNQARPVVRHTAEMTSIIRNRGTCTDNPPSSGIVDHNLLLLRDPAPTGDQGTC